MPKQKKPEKYRGWENPRLAREQAEQARSNAAGFHLPKYTARARTRGAAVRKAVRDFD
jgi:hypothetical protein